jgi:hypothetical protein
MKRVNEMQGPKSTTAWALIYEGHYAGKIIANWSNNPSGSVCSASVIIHSGPLNYPKFNYGNIGKAGGYGYDKLSQAVWQCFQNAGVECKVLQPANGRTSDEFEEWGYVLAQIL